MTFSTLTALYLFSPSYIVKGKTPAISDGGFSLVRE
jgi:hypothetical protein